MTETIFSETVFDNNITDIEKVILQINYFDLISYFQNTSHLKRLSDLHFIFLIRKDNENRLRIIEAINQLNGTDKIEVFTTA